MNNKRILVVDDEKPVRTMCRSLFEFDGYEVLEASSAPAALAILERERVPVMLVDVKMPGMSGLDLLDKVKTSFPNIAVVIMTGSDPEATEKVAYASGAAYFIKKLFQSVRRLIAEITKLLESDSSS